MSMSSSSGLMGTELISAPKIHQPYNNNMSSASQMVMGGKMRSGSRAISATHFRREFLLGLRAAAAATAQHPETALRCRHGRRRRRRRRRLDHVIAMVRDQSEDSSITSSSPPSTTTNGVGVSEIKEALHQSLQGINRGIFGVTSSTKSEIERLVMQLESLNPNPNPTSDLQKVGGSWRLIFTTITILGSKRTKLGLRDFISLDDFFQVIVVDEGKAANVIKFSVRGLNLFNGQLTIEASYTIASPKRVHLKGQKSSIVPDQLMNIFKKNYDLLLSIFNPEGWHEITYLDEDMRIGRDDKGNLFVLEKSDEETDFRSNELFEGLQGSNLL